jgi:hypothetical protein
LNAIDLSPRVFELVAVDLRRGAGHPSAGTVHDCQHHLQIAQQFGCWLGRRGALWARFHLPLRFEKQLGLVENALANHRRAVAPGGIQLPGLPRVTVMFGECRGHPLAIVQADARYRHQIFHRQMRRYFALANLLLDRLREKLDQRQPPRHPTGAAIKPARQLIQPIAEALLHLLKQPALFQRGLVFGETQGTVQQQSLGLAHRPDHRFHCVAAQLLERRDAFIAVDNQVTAGMAGGGHHHNGRLLA